ncbi:MAG: hypothetical protein JWL63_596 [Rhodocyclales bacterium]|nr:hypothetical protein [Rhodocyclales bacterium]
MKQMTRTIGLALCAGVFLTGRAWGADVPEGFSVVASQIFTHDANLYRLPDGQSPTIAGFPQQRSDTISTTAAQAIFEHTYSLQKVHGDVELRHNAFQTFDYLDYTATNIHGFWDWALGKRLSGRVSASQDESLRAFSDFSLATKSVNTYRRLAVDGNYWFHPEWSTGFGFIQVASRYSDAQSDLSAYDERAYEAKLNFRPSSGNIIALVLRQADGEYPNRISGGTGVKEYRQRDVLLRGEWGVTGLSRLNGYIGLTQREYPGAASRDFSGVTGRLSYNWQATGKLNIVTTVRREIGAQEDLTDNYVVTTAAGMNATWQFSALFAIGGSLESRYRDYGGDPGFGLSPAVGRNDRTDTVGVSLKYTPVRWLGVTLGVQREARTADNSASDYKDTIVGLAATARF